MDLSDLKRIVRAGEGDHLEFKRKANHPEKLAREVIAFANTKGGILLVGVDDDTTIYGCKYIEEDMFALQQFFDKRIAPRISLQMEKIPVTARRNVLAIHVKESLKKPHFLLPEIKGEKKNTFVRVKDMSVLASREMTQILRHQNNHKGVSLQVGDAEQKLLQHLDEHARITLESAKQLLKTSKRTASTKLILLARAGILMIHPSEKGDYFTLAPDAFESS